MENIKRKKLMGLQKQQQQMVVKNQLKNTIQCVMENMNHLWYVRGRDIHIRDIPDKVCLVPDIEYKSLLGLNMI